MNIATVLIDLRLPKQCNNSSKEKCCREQDARAPRRTSQSIDYERRAYCSSVQRREREHDEPELLSV